MKSNSRIVWIHACLAASLWLASGLSADVAENEEAAAPVPRWIWANDSRDQNDTALFLKTFDIPGVVEHATLAGVADFAHAAIFLNGKAIVEVEPYEPRFERDVSTLVRTGQNVIAIRAAGCDGPSAVALTLHVETKDGEQQTVATDASWISSTKELQAEKQPDVNLPAWRPATEFGPVANEPWGSGNQVAVNPLDDYTQWKRALGTDESTDPSSFIVPENFEIQLLRSALKDEGSWVSMAFDPQGRVVIGKEDRGLLRMTLDEDGEEIAKVELINDTLQECRGLLFAFDALYVNANNSKGLYRLRDTDDDDQFDEVKLLYHSPGSVGHGRNDLTLGRDNMIYSIHGDAVDLPRDGFHDLTSPFREHRRGVNTREGHVIRTDAEGTKWELVTAGLRNPFGIAFNSDGEMFTYDADAEFDMGSSWYRPTRVNHLLPSGDFGWRGVTKQWPPYFPDHPDAAPPTLDIGKGSPTAVKFGYKSNFPPKYRDALYVLDWAYGRIIGVYMTPRGATYGCRAETFVRGRPLNVTNLDFGPDGAMYFVTGGRKTKSGLYRIRYVGDKVETAQPTPQQLARAEHAENSRTTRRWLESMHGKQDSKTVEVAWRYFDDPDPTIRHAARIAVEHQPVDSWQERALTEERPTAALTALMSLAASDAKDAAEKIVARLNGMSLDALTNGQLLLALRTYEICLQKQQELPESLATPVAEQLDALYPHRSARINQELSKLLLQLGAPAVVSKTLDLLDDAKQQSEQLHYLFVIRNAKSGWTDELRDRYFNWFRNTKQFLGGEGLPGFLKRIRDDALTSLDAGQRAKAAAILAAIDRENQLIVLPSTTRPLVKEWTVEELLAALAENNGPRDFARGKAMFTTAACIGCHRVGREGNAVGPDLTAVASRFSRRDILESIIAPSEVVAENYQSDVIVTTSGQVITGRILQAGDYRSPVLHISTDPLDSTKSTLIPKTDIESHTKSRVSRMPESLLNTLSQDEILDLMAYIEAAGNADHPLFKKLN